MSTPLFSVVVPLYNRAAVIGRCLESCLREPDADFEVVVVDDGSSDDGPELVARIADPRLRLIRHPANRGWCVARNTGTRAARGRWILFLDSDDTLVPGWPDSMRRAIAAAEAAGAHKVFTMCEWTTGIRSPEPPLTGQVWDYRGWIRWLDFMVGRPTEANPCARREALLEVPYPENGYSPEGIHLLDFSRRFLTMGWPEVMRVYHQGGDDRIMNASGARLLKYAEASLEEAVQVLERHGAVMADIAPRLLATYYHRAALQAMLCGRRLEGIRHSARHIRSRPASWSAWGILLAGLMGRRVLIFAHALHARVGSA